MRPLWLVVVGIALPALVAAETRRTTVGVTVRKRAGEKAAALVVIPAGTDVEVVREDGRWVVVRVNGVEGYITRTTLSAPPNGEPATPAVWSAAPHDDWTTRSEVVGAASAPAQSTDAAAPFHATAPRSLELRFGAGLGFRSLGMDLTSNSGGGLTNYLVDADAVAATLDIDGLLRPAGAWIVGFDALAQTTVASPGIDYPGPTSAAGTVAFRTVAGEVGVRAGRRVRDSIELAVRLAGHYDAFLPRAVDNAGMLPRERLLGATVGARAELRPLTSRFSAALRVDVLAIGRRAQTPGLEDGTSSTARAVWGGVTVRLAVTHRWTVFGTYDFARMATTWSGMSNRQPGVTSTHRVDTAQVAQLGVGAEL